MKNLHLCVYRKSILDDIIWAKHDVHVHTIMSDFFIHYYVLVDDMALGQYLYLQKDDSVSVNIEEGGDSEEVKQVKSLLQVMISRDASARPSIQDVVDNLAYLLTFWKAQHLSEVPSIIKGKHSSFDISARV